MGENENRNDHNNISIPKPVFALLILALCGSVCYSTYNAGYMKGIEKGQSSGNVQETDPAPKAAPAPEASEPQASSPGLPDDDIFLPGKGFNFNNEEAEKNENDKQGAFLDIVAATVSDEERESYNIPAGVLIVKVSKGGAAEKAGLKEHSVITAVDGKAILSIEELKSTLGEKHPGDIVQLSYYEPTESHGFEQKTVSVTLSDGEAVSKER